MVAGRTWYSLVIERIGSHCSTNFVEGDLGEQFLGLLVVNGRVDNDILSFVPVDWGGNFVLITELQGVNDTVH